MLESSWIRSEADPGFVAYSIWRLYVQNGGWPRLLLGIVPSSNGFRLEAMHMANANSRELVPVPNELTRDATILLAVAAKTRKNE